MEVPREHKGVAGQLLRHLPFGNHRLPFHFWSQMILCVTVLKYLSVLEDPGWGRQVVRSTVDIISTMDSVTQKLDLSSDELGPRSDENLFMLLSKLLTKCRIWAVVRLSQGSLDKDGESCQSADPATTKTGYMPDLDHMVWMQSMDLESDQWLEDAMGWLAGSSHME